MNTQQLLDTARHLDPVSLKLRVSSASVVAAVDVPTVTLPDGAATSSDVMSQSHEKPCEVVSWRSTQAVTGGVGMCGGLRRRALTFPSGAGSKICIQPEKGPRLVAAA